MLKKWCSAVALFVFVQGIFDGRGHTIYGLNAENSIVVSKVALLREATMWMAFSRTHSWLFQFGEGHRFGKGDCQNGFLV